MAANANANVPPVPPPPLTVLDGIVACGFSNVVQANVGSSPAQRVSSQLYFDTFAMCLTLTDKQIDNAFKAFSDLPIADGRIKVMPGLITKVKAFTQHIAHTLRLQRNPEEHAFDPTLTVMLTKQRVQQVKFESDYKSEIEGAKPAIFSTTTVWIEWNRAFYNYLKLIPSNRGIPLCYIIRDNDDEDRTQQTLFQDEYILVAPLTGADYNTDNAIAVSIKAREILLSLEGDTVKYKNGKIEPPTMYLGGKLQRKELDGELYWTITSVDYVNAAVATIKQALKDKTWTLPNKVTTPMSMTYLPELDITPELDADDTQFYQEMMGMLRWATELGRVDILHEISLLSQYQASPRQGHMEQALHIFAFLDKKPKTTIYMNSTEPAIEQEDFRAQPEEFMEYYRDAKEQLPHRMPKPRGKSVITLAFCDASYAANKKTRKSHSGYIIFVNKAPIKWVSKRQNTLETSAFSAEFIALKQCIEDIEHIRFKLRMFGVPISEDDPATYIYCDNDSVVKNSTRVDSTLNKKHSEVAYHFTRWNVTAKVCTIGWIETGYNLADALTKRLAAKTRDFLFGEWTY